MVNGAASSSVSFCAIASAANSPAADSRMANSSPPNRAAKSFARMAPLTRAATSRSRWSPTGCPRVSLTSLKWSRSKYRSANGWAPRRHDANAASRTSAKARRFIRPVRASVCARLEICSCARSSRSAWRLEVETWNSAIAPISRLAASTSQARSCRMASGPSGNGAATMVQRASPAVSVSVTWRPAVMSAWVLAISVGRTCARSGRSRDTWACSGRASGAGSAANRKRSRPRGAVDVVTM